MTILLLQKKPSKKSESLAHSLGQQQGDFEECDFLGQWPTEGHWWNPSGGGGQQGGPKTNRILLGLIFYPNFVISYAFARRVEMFWLETIFDLLQKPLVFVSLFPSGGSAEPGGQTTGGFCADAKVEGPILRPQRVTLATFCPKGERVSLVFSGFQKVFLGLVEAGLFVLFCRTHATN